MRVALLSLFLSAFMIGTVSADPKEQTLKIVADEWPPFSGNDLPHKGLSLHVISAVFQHAGYDVETQVVPWARIMDGATRNEFDVVGSLFFDPSLAELLTYSMPFYETDVRMVQGAGGTYEFTNVRDLANVSIAVGDGFLYEDEFDKADYLNKITVTDTLQALRMVAYGRSDLTLDSVDVVNYSINQLAPELRNRLELVPGTLATQSVHMALRNNLPGLEEVLADFNTSLAEMSRDGTLASLISTHITP